MYSILSAFEHTSINILLTDIPQGESKFTKLYFANDAFSCTQDELHE